jgi:hypothetical protein
MVADMIGARRPSVTTALAALRQKGTVECAQERWLLRRPAAADGSPRRGTVPEEGSRPSDSQRYSQKVSLYGEQR